MDCWCQQHTGQPFDDERRWARQRDRCMPALLAGLAGRALLCSKPPPKSTGRDLFNPPGCRSSWRHLPTLAPQDVQATLTELTASVLCDEPQALCDGSSEH